jgi:hypothetical protein
MEYSGAGGKLIHEKNQKQKSRDTVPLGIAFILLYFTHTLSLFCGRLYHEMSIFGKVQKTMFNSYQSCNSPGFDLTSSDTVEPEGRQMNKCWTQYLKRSSKIPLLILSV